MKITQAIHLLAFTTVLSAGTALAQTTPTGTATSTTYPTGAVAPDSAPASGRNANRAANRRRNRTNPNTTTGSSQTGTAGASNSGDARYRQSSSANGTSINNSNSTNYNSNNVTNAPTGAGSNPSATGTTTTPPGNPDISQNGSMSSGTTMSGGSSGSMAAQTNATSSTATGMAVKAARTTEEPAVKAGSTARNTTIRDFVSSSPNYVTLQNALQSAELSQKLKESGPYTVFAPSNSAFKKLPTAVQNSLLEGRNHSALVKLLSYHVVNGSVDAAELTRQIKAGSGKARLQTLAGGTLTAQLGANGQIVLTDEQGGTAHVDAADTYQTNGVIHGIDAVLSPTGGLSAFR